MVQLGGFFFRAEGQSQFPRPAAAYFSKFQGFRLNPHAALVDSIGKPTLRCNDAATAADIPSLEGG